MEAIRSAPTSPSHFESSTAAAEPGGWRATGIVSGVLW
jgi:hypothetical protein